MQINDKVRIKSSPYTMFEVGSTHTISYIDTAEGGNRPYGIYLVDPFYENSDENPYFSAELRQFHWDRYQYQKDLIEMLLEVEE